MPNVNPINRVPFGQEKTREDFLARAAWEYDQASRLRAARRPVGYAALAEGHERAARDYERAAQGRLSGSTGRSHATKARSWPHDVKIGDEVYAVSGGRRHGPGIVEEIYSDGTMRVDFTRQFGGRLRVRPEDLVDAPRSHARKKKIDAREARRLLEADGINFARDFHELSSYETQRVLEIAKLAGYKKRKDAPGSTARMYFQYLSRLKNHATKRGKHTVYDLVEVNTRTKKERVLHEHFSTKADANEAADEYRARKRPDVTYRIRSRQVSAPPYRWNPED